MILPWLLPGIGGSLATYDKFQEREIKEDYLKNVQGIDISNMSGEDLKKLRDETSLETALEALRNGTAAGAKRGNELFNLYNNEMTVANQAGVNKNAQEYYANAIMALSQQDMNSMREN